MGKRKYPSELNTKLVRVYTGDYALLKRLAEGLDISMAEALRRAISEDMTVLKAASHKFKEVI